MLVSVNISVHELDISELSSGVYIIKVITNEILTTTKIIKT